METQISAEEFIQSLEKENIKTWFDLGIFLDSVRENRKIPAKVCTGDFQKFKNELSNGNLAFLSFYYSIDGVTIEIDKYAQSFEREFPGIGIHLLAGKIHSEARTIFSPDYHFYEVKEADGFDNWSLYQDFFHTKLQRGSTKYNRLITEFWAQIKRIAGRLANYVKKNNINLLYVINA